ncbi:MAG: putative type modification methyltransferase, subunit [Segetibacter sp.]|nr:putative type modification methyltransferase, subunit [Segetibacter sp.]
MATIVLLSIIYIFKPSMLTTNQNPGQLVHDEINSALVRRGQQVQSKKRINLAAGVGVNIRQYQTNMDPADYILFVTQTFTTK